MFLPLIIPQETRDQLDLIERDDRVELINKCVHALIVLGQGGGPIKKNDLNRLIFSNRSYRVANQITQASNLVLNRVYNLRLFETTDQSKYLLVNSKPGLMSLGPVTDEKCKELTVLYFTLMAIFGVPDDKMSEKELLFSLCSLRLDHQGDDNKNVLNYLSSFLKKQYITSTTEQDLKYFSWGPRAKAELDLDVFFQQFVMQTPDTKESDWPDQKKKIEDIKVSIQRQ